MGFAISRKTLNDLHLGLCFTILYAGSSSMYHIQQMFFVSINHDNPLYDVNGYVTFGVSYVCTSLATLIAPSLVTMIGWKSTMLLGSITYTYFVLYYFENSWLSFFGLGILNGFGGGFLWLSQGTYLIWNSEVKSTTQSVGIFWTMHQSSFFIGNIIVYCLFNGNDNLYLSRSMRQEVIIILASIVVCAIISFSLLRDPIRQNQVDELQSTAMGEIKDLYRTMISKDTLLNNFLYIYSGFHSAFLNVMGSSLGFTQYLSDNSKTFTPLSAIIQGVGAIFGIIFVACLKRKSILRLRAIPIGCIFGMVTYIMVFLALPSSSAFTYTNEEPIIKLSIYVLMIGNFLIGFGDTCISTEFYNYIGYTHPYKCTPPITHLKFIRSLASGVSFCFICYLNLQIQTAILMLLSILSFLIFYASWNNAYSSESEEVKSEKNSKNISESVSDL